MSGSAPGIGSDLVARARAGDRTALEALLREAWPLVHRWALVQTGEPADADDLTQDVLVQVIRKLESWQGDGRFTTWLYSVTKNAAADRRRRADRRRSLAEGRTDVAEWTAPAPDPSAEAERRDTAARVHVLLRELPERQREVFELVELQGLPAADAAERMGIEPVSVRAHLFKARRTLRARMLERSPELMDGAP